MKCILSVSYELYQRILRTDDGKWTAVYNTRGQKVHQFIIALMLGFFTLMIIKNCLRSKLLSSQ